MNIYDYLQAVSVGSTALLPPALHRAGAQLSPKATRAPAADPALPFPLLSPSLHQPQPPRSSAEDPLVGSTLGNRTPASALVISLLRAGASPHDSYSASHM